MFLSKFFSNARAKVMCALAGLTLVFGAGAAISAGVSAVNDNEVVETKAAADEAHVVNTVYLKLNASYWGQAAAYYSVHLWGGKASTTWPGVYFNNGNTASGSSEISADVSNYAGFTHMIIVRWANNGKGSTEWNRWSHFADGNDGQPNNEMDANKYNYFTNNGWQSNYDGGMSYSLNTSKSGYVSLPSTGYYLMGTGLNYSGSSYSTTWSQSTWVAADSPAVTGNVASWSNAKFGVSDNYGSGSDRGFKIVKFTRNATGGQTDYYNLVIAGRADDNGWFSGGGAYDGGPNFKCLVAGTYNVYYQSGTDVYFSKNISADVYTVVDGVSTKVRTDTKSSDETYSPTVPTVTGYTADGVWHLSSGSGTVWSSGSYLTSAISLYMNYAINTYTINYTFVVDGVPQTERYWNGSSWASGSLTASISADYGTLFNTLTEPTLYGASFDGWYSDSTCKTALSTTAISKNYAATEAYAKFTTDSSSSNLYVGIDGSVGQNKYLLRSWSADAQGYTWVYYTNGTKSAGIKVQELTSISVSGWKYFRFRVPSDATSVVLCKGEWGTNGAYQAQTIDLHPGSGTTTTTDSYANGHNLFVVGSTQTENAKRTGEWKDIQYYLDVASNTAFTASLTTHTMSAPNNPSTGNTAEVMKVSVPSGYYVRGKYVVNGTTGYNITKGGEDGSSSSSLYSEQTSGVGVHFKAAKTCNFYINTSGDIWIVDCSGITAGGYLYISTQLTPAQIKVDCSVDGSDYFSGAKLSTVDDVLTTTTLTYDGVKGLIIVPVYHLRKGENKTAGTAYSITLTSASDSSRTTSVTGVTVNSSNKVYTINLSTASSWSASTAVSETYGSVATLAYDIDAAVKAAENGSVCNVFESTASTLATRYNTLAETSDYRTKLEAASIESYNYGWSEGVGTYEKDVMISNGSKGSIGLAYIYAELCSRGNVAAIYAPAGARIIPNKKEDSPLTTTLWIVLGAGLAGLTAIGAAYFISKKRKRA